MKEVIAKLERILELTSTHGISINNNELATDDSQLKYVESKIRLNAIQALNVIDSAHIEKEKPKRVKVEYVKWNFECAWHAVKAFEDGEKLYTKRSHKDFVLIDSAQDVLRFLYDLHERIETEIDERQEFIDEVERIGAEVSSDGEWSFACLASVMLDSGFKLVNAD